MFNRLPSGRLILFSYDSNRNHLVVHRTDYLRLHLLAGMHRNNGHHLVGIQDRHGYRDTNGEMGGRTMKVSQMIEELSRLPQDAEVYGIKGFGMPDKVESVGYESELMVVVIRAED